MVLHHIVLDLDGTLVCDEAWQIPIARPFLHEFILFLFSNCASVSIWTAASKEWLNTVCKHIFEPILKHTTYTFLHKWSDERCSLRPNWQAIEDGGEWNRSQFVVKRLKKIWRCNTTPLKLTRQNTLIVDNHPTTYKDNYGNAIPIRTWIASASDADLDTELLKLMEWMQRILCHHDNVLTLNKQIR